MKPKFTIKMSLITVCKTRVVSTRSIVLPTSAPRKRARLYWETKSRSNVNTAYADGKAQMGSNSLPVADVDYIRLIRFSLDDTDDVRYPK